MCDALAGAGQVSRREGSRQEHGKERVACAGQQGGTVPLPAGVLFLQVIRDLSCRMEAYHRRLCVCVVPIATYIAHPNDGS